MYGDDAVLLEKWRRNRNADAFAEVVARYADMVYATSRRVLGSPTDAEDVAQECFVELAQSAFRVRASLGGWLYTRAVHRSLNLLRGKRRRTAREREYPQRTSTTLDPSRAEVQHLVDEAIVVLPERLRTPLVAHFFEGQSYSVVAKNLGIPRSTAAHRVQKGVERIRRALRAKGVVVPAGLLTSALAAETAEAAPPTLASGLVKLALAGTVGPTVPAGVAPVAGGVLLMKMKIAVFLAVLIVGTALYLVFTQTKKEVPPPKDPMKDAVLIPGPVSPDAAETSEDSMTVENAATADEANGGFLAPAVETLPASISGHVTDPDGNGLAGASVDLEVYREVRKEKQELGTYHVTANDDGAYQIGPINVFGHVRLAATAEGYVLLDSGLGRRVSGSPDIQVIAEGEDLKNVDFRLPRALDYVSGRVINQSRIAVEGAHITVAKQGGGVKGQDSQDVYYGVSGENGAFAIPVPSVAECVLVARKEGYGTGFFPGIVPGTPGLELVLREGGAIAGTVSDTSGRPLKNADVLVISEKLPGDIGNPWQSTGRLETITDADGAYRADDLSDEFTYTVRVPVTSTEGRDPAQSPHTLAEFLKTSERVVHSVRELRFGYFPKEVLAEKAGVQVRAGQETTCNLTVENSALVPATIHGHVLDPSTHRPVCPLFVSAFSERFDPQSPVLAMAVVQQDGSYRLSILGLVETTEISVKAGYYYAPQPIGAGLLRNVTEQPEVTTIQLAPGEDREINFTIPAPGMVTARCVDVNGEPLAGLEVNEAVTDADGRVWLYGLAPGVTHELVVRREHRTATSRGRPVVGRSDPFVVEPGQTLPEMEIVCTSPGAITGRVVLTNIDISQIPEEEFPEAYMSAKLEYTDGRRESGIALIHRDGSFTFEAVGPGVCNLSIGIVGLDEVHTLEDLNVAPDMTTDIGSLQFTVDLPL